VKYFFQIFRLYFNFLNPFLKHSFRHFTAAQAGTPQAFNYAAAMQLGQAGAQLPIYGMNPHDQLAYRQYQQSHAKPPYSYISLIAMAIQVKTLFSLKISHKNFPQDKILTF
jgi:hypothetical protein